MTQWTKIQGIHHDIKAQSVDNRWKRGEEIHCRFWDENRMGDFSRRAIASAFPHKKSARFTDVFIIFRAIYSA